MPDLTGRRIRKWLAVVCIASAVLLLLLFSWLPYLTEKLLVTILLPAPINEQYGISIYRLGPGGCTLKITGRPEAEPFITTGNIQMHWSLAGLRNRRLDRLVVDGLQVRIINRGQGGGSGTPSAMSMLPDPEAPRAEYSKEVTLPIFIDTIQVVNSTVTYGSDNLHYTIPVSLDGQLSKSTKPQENKNILRYTFSLALAAQELKGELAFDRQVLTGSITGDIDLDRLAGCIGNFISPLPEISGIAETDFSAALQVAPFSLKHLQAEARLRNFLVRYQDLLISGNEMDTPLLSLAGSQEKIMVTAAGLSLENPLQAAARFEGAVSFSDGSVQWQGNLDVKPVDGQKMFREYALVSSAPMGFEIQGSSGENDLQWTVKTLQQEDQQAEQFILDRGGLRIAAGTFSMESAWHYFLANGKKQLHGDLFVQSGGLTVDSPEVQLDFPRVQLDGKIVLDKKQNDSGFAFTGRMHVDDSSLRLTHQDISLLGMRIKTPVSWPPGENRSTGDFTIENIHMQNTALGTLQAKLSQEPDGMGFDGELTSNLVPDGSVSFSGSLHVPKGIHPFAAVSFSASNVPLTTENFTSAFPAVQAYSGSGLFSMDGRLTVQQDRVGGFLDVKIHDGTLEIPKIGIRADKIDFDANFPDFPAIHTSPAQKLSVGSLTVKKLSVSDISSSFRLESPQSLFFEEISADWSGGRVMTGSLRLNKNNPGFEAALLCDRLDLAAVLTQLGLARAEGSGKVSGLIPLLYDKGNFYVDEGFLFSTPGETGTLKILQSEQLTSGLPEEIPHLSPIYFAGAALKDFQYNWAKLLVSSEDENLLLKLQIDGRPAKKLPYRFDSQGNVFVRLAEGESGGIDQPVKLDVNFNIPLNELLQYYKEMQPVLHNIR